MGRYVTCSLCGKMEKYGIGCDCYYKEYLENLAKMKGAVVVDIVPLRYESAVLYKLEKLCPVPEVSCLRQTKTFCLWMNLCAGGEYNSYRQLYEISETDFEENKKGEEEAEKEEKEEEEEEEEEAREGRGAKKEEEEEGRPLRVLEEGDVLKEEERMPRRIRCVEVLPREMSFPTAKLSRRTIFTSSSSIKMSLHPTMTS